MAACPADPVLARHLVIHVREPADHNARPGQAVCHRPDLFRARSFLRRPHGRLLYWKVRRSCRASGSIEATWRVSGQFGSNTVAITWTHAATLAHRHGTYSRADGCSHGLHRHSRWHGRSWLGRVQQLDPSAATACGTSMSHCRLQLASGGAKRRTSSSASHIMRAMTRSPTFKATARSAMKAIVHMTWVPVGFLRKSVVQHG
jgi:hypothetical protein